DGLVDVRPVLRNVVADDVVPTAQVHLAPGDGGRTKYTRQIRHLRQYRIMNIGRRFEHTHGVSILTFVCVHLAVGNHRTWSFVTQAAFPFPLSLPGLDVHAFTPGLTEEVCIALIHHGTGPTTTCDVFQ